MNDKSVFEYSEYWWLMMSHDFFEVLMFRNDSKSLIFGHSKTWLDFERTNDRSRENIHGWLKNRFSDFIKRNPKILESIEFIAIWWFDVNYCSEKSYSNSSKMEREFPGNNSDRWPNNSSADQKYTCGRGGCLRLNFVR